MFKKLLIFGVAAVAIAIGIFVVRPSPNSSAKTSGPTSGRPSALSVYTHIAEARPLTERVTATGVVLADEGVDLTAETTGLVVKLNLAEGAEVRAGDLLVKLNDAELQAELARARQQVSIARLQTERQKRLLDSQGASQEAYDLALNELRVREAEVALIDARIAKTEILAPFDGVVGLRYVSPGGFITPDTRIATLQKTRSLKIDLSLPERHMDRIAPGAAVSIRVAGLSEPFPGEIYAIDPKIDESTRTLRLRARADNPGGRVLPGAFATVEIALKEIPDAILVPAGAIIPGLNEKTVFVLADGKAEQRTVKTGLRLASDILVTSGINHGDVVITSGQLQLRPGMSVTPVAREQNKPGSDARQP